MAVGSGPCPAEQGCLAPEWRAEYLVVLAIRHLPVKDPCLKPEVLRLSGIVSADRKRGRRKGAKSKNVKNRQKVSKSFSTLFDNFRAGQKNSKIVKKRQKAF